MVHQHVINLAVMWLHILVGPCWCVYVAMFGNSVTLASMDNALPEEGTPTPKHVGGILMYILIMFSLRQSLVH
jgi:hypothetical protein